MTDERHKSSGRPTARDVPFVRGAGTDSEPTPRGVRPAQLPRDPTYEAELAQVELAVLRDPRPREDPSTKQGGRFARHSTLKPPPESVTPESPLARTPPLPVRSPHSPGSGGRSVASGTLLSVGAVDPRGKTERTLETPRMFISQHQGTEAYFKPTKIPAVTVHQAIESDTVKLSDSIDPRRAKTIPRLDRAALAQLSEMEPIPDSEMPLAMSEPASSLAVSPAYSPRWNQEAWDVEDERLRSDQDHPHDGQIHASLSAFRDAPASSFQLDDVPTRVEPLAGRRLSEEAPPPSVAPDTSTVPTQRDLPVHRIEASQPPPPPPRSSPVSLRVGSAAGSAGPEPTTASIAVEEPALRPGFVNYAAFVAALLLAVVIGLYVTRDPKSHVTSPAPPAVPAVSEPAAAEPRRAPGSDAPAPPVVHTPSAPAQSPGSTQPPLSESAVVASPTAPTARPAAVPRRVEGAPTPFNPPSASPPPSSAPRTAAPAKTPRETIF